MNRSFGKPEILWKNEQHKKLVGLLNSLHESTSNKAGDVKLKNILAELTAYTDEHFAYEDELYGPSLTERGVQ